MRRFYINIIQLFFAKYSFYRWAYIIILNSQFSIILYCISGSGDVSKDEWVSVFKSEFGGSGEEAARVSYIIR